jgi:hypothetical protein
MESPPPDGERVLSILTARLLEMPASGTKHALQQRSTARPLLHRECAECVAQQARLVSLRGTCSSAGPARFEARCFRLAATLLPATAGAPRP